MSTHDEKEVSGYLPFFLGLLVIGLSAVLVWAIWRFTGWVIVFSFFIPLIGAYFTLAGIYMGLRAARGVAQVLERLVVYAVVLGSYGGLLYFGYRQIFGNSWPDDWFIRTWWWIWEL